MKTMLLFFKYLFFMWRNLSQISAILFAQALSLKPVATRFALKKKPNIDYMKVLGDNCQQFALNKLIKEKLVEYKIFKIDCFILL